MPRINPCLVANSGGDGGQGESGGLVRPAAAGEDTGPADCPCEGRGVGIPLPTRERKTGAAATAVALRR